MNDIKIVQRLLPLVSDEIIWHRLKDYLDSQREHLIKTLILSHDIKQINRTQGKVELLDNLLGLRDTVRKSI